VDRDRREHARLDIMVEVSVRQGAKVSQLHAANISAGGMFLEVDAGAYPGVAIGDEVAIHLDMGSDRFGRPLEIRTPCGWSASTWVAPAGTPASPSCGRRRTRRWCTRWRSCSSTWPRSRAAAEGDSPR
jgi:hypothetical protein